MSSRVSSGTTRADGDLTTPARAGRFGWRIVDIVVSAVLGVASGLLFWLLDGPGNSLWSVADAALPGLGGIANGVWLFAGPLGGLIIRKPGAAILVETIAACVEAGLGNQWGIGNIWIGILQGIGAEIAFAIFLYRRFGPDVALLSGALAGVGCWLYSYLMGDLAKTFSYNAIYLVTSMISGAVVGVLAWMLTRALAGTGALDRFASGRRQAI